MGFRLGFGGGCSPCCGGGGTVPTDPPCLASLRPAGETRAITSIDVTIKASDYTVSVPAASPYTGAYTFTYKFPGAAYNGTFALTPAPITAAWQFEYVFPFCGGTRSRIRFYSANCRFVFDFHALRSNSAVPACSNPSGGGVLVRLADVIATSGTVASTSIGHAGKAAMEWNGISWLISPTTGNRIKEQIEQILLLGASRTNALMVTGGFQDDATHAPTMVFGVDTLGSTLTPTGPVTESGSPAIEFGSTTAFTVTYGP